MARTQLGATPKKRPPTLRIATTCRPETRAWWKAWVSSPNAAMFTPIMWNRLQLVAVLVEGFYENPTGTALAEIRRCEADLGAMPADRARLRWDLPEPGPAPQRGSTLKSVKAVEGDEFAQRRADVVDMLRGRAKAMDPGSGPA